MVGVLWVRGYVCRCGFSNKNIYQFSFVQTDIEP